MAFPRFPPPGVHMPDLPSHPIAGLTPIGDHARGYPAGIFVTPDVIGRIGEGTTDQFKAQSDVYDERYFEREERIQCVARALALFPDFDRHAARHVLDIGCGSGTAPFPLLDLVPGARVYATDISPDMVAILARRAESQGKADRIVAFVSDAERVDLAPDTFDLIVGASMVHHLLDPDRFVDRILRSLKPGGLCLFTEPFKAGHLILRHFLSELTTLPALSDGIPARILDFFTSYIFTIDAMCTLDRTRLDYATLDDKWMFSRRFFEDCAARNAVRYGFFSINPAENRFASNIERLVWYGLGLRWELPEPARSFVGRFDAALPADVMDEFASEGCVVFMKRR
jgi:SAM-dependent methyltransferase